MLRSIFSLIQKILDSSEKQYNNTKSRAVIYCLTKPDNTINMDLEIDGTKIVTKSILNTPIDSAPDKPELPSTSHFEIKTEQGDVVVCKHNAEKTIVPKKTADNEDINKFEPDTEVEKKTFVNEEVTKDGDGMISEEVGPNVQDVLDGYPRKRFIISESETDQMSKILDQITKMKTGLQHLTDITDQLNKSGRFVQDLNFLKENIDAALGSSGKQKSEDKELSSKL